MPSGAKTLLTLLLIPFLLGLGHDIYISYLSDDQKIAQVKRLQISPDDFMVSDLGWVWNEYHPSSMEMFRDTTEPETWANKVDPILQLATMQAGIIPFAIGVAFLMIAFIIGIWPFSRFGRKRGGNEDDYAVYKHAKSNGIKYSKK